jgi:4-aminobutyrate aminotransferase-like enzyme
MKYHKPAQILSAARQELIAGNVRTSYRNPLHIVRASMQYVYDETGRRYIDGYNNVPHVGHCHPVVVENAARQLGQLNTNTRYLHESLEQFASNLIATLPAPLRVCYFVNSGSEANELALRLARAHTRARQLIVLEAAYHGNTTTLIDISPYKADGPGGTGHASWVHVVPLADVYRGVHKATDPEAGLKYAAPVADAIARMRAAGEHLCGFIAESCPSVGGQIIFPAGYLAEVYRHVRNAGGVCIADEVQTAYGRPGHSFYAFAEQRVIPDIVVLGKPIGNGFPIGAVVTTRDIAASFDNGMEFFSTFGGSTVSCVVGVSVLQIVLADRLQQHASRVGAGLLARLRSLPSRYELVGDVRGSGLFIGVELVNSRSTLEPAPKAADDVVNFMRESGVLIGTDGPYHNVLKVRPPMPFGDEDAQALFECLERALTAVSSSPAR